MKWLVKLYPREWRERYGEEFVALLEGQPFSFRTVANVVLGAVDANIHRLRPA